MCGFHSHCRLCAEPSRRLVGVDDEVGAGCDLRQKMLLVSVDVSAPSPLPRSVCFPCLSLLEKTATFLAQVSAAQDKLSLIYQEKKDLFEESDNLNEDFDFGVKEEHHDVVKVEIKIEPGRDKLPEETPTSEVPDIAVKRKKSVQLKKKIGISTQKVDINIKPLNIVNKKENNTRPQRQSRRNKETKNYAEEHPISKQRKEKNVARGKYVCDCGVVKNSAFKLKLHQEIHSDKRPLDYSCHICGKAYIAYSSLYNHLATHKPKRFKCEYCKKEFHEHSVLKKHVTQHSSDRPFPCDQCNMSFAQKRHLTRHSAVHSEVRPHVCSDCDKGFKTRKALIIHMRVHTGVKPYSCEFCGKQDHDLANHYKHVRTVHGGDPIKPKNPDDDNSAMNGID